MEKFPFTDNLRKKPKHNECAEYSGLCASEKDHTFLFICQAITAVVLRAQNWGSNLLVWDFIPRKCLWKTLQFPTKLSHKIHLVFFPSQ